MFLSELIDKNTPIPMYYQLKQLILKDMKDGTLKPGDCLPTEQELIEHFNVSRTTVRQAILELVREGYLNRTKGKGTFVAKQKIQQDFMQRLEPFREQMKRLNIQYTTEVLDKCKTAANKEIAESLDIQERDPVVRILRLRSAENEPVVLVETFLNWTCAFVLEAALENESLYDLLGSNNGTRITTAERHFVAVGAGKYESEMLKVPEGSALQLVTTVGLNCFGTPIEYSIAKYVGAKNQFSVRLSVE